MRVQPVPGWRTSTSDLGLPDGSRIASSDDPYWSNAFVGYLGDDAFFVAGNPGRSNPQWWLVALDVGDGQRLFDPVQLNGDTRAPKCFLNGPNTVLCLQDEVDSGTAWVIDARTGRVSYTGATDLRTQPSKLMVHQIGIYAVAETQYEGIYGVGPRGETTWFVPGDGSTAKRPGPDTDLAPQTLAAQVTGGRGSNQMVVFSIVDGSVVTPEIVEGLHPLSAAVYPGGFAVEVVEDESKSTPDGVEFFDDKGKRLGKADVSDFLSTTSLDVPIVESVPESIVFSRDGFELAHISRFGPGDSALLIGSRLFVDERKSETSWQQYDLRAGTKGKACKLYMGGYLGSDGTTGVFETGNPNVGLVTTAMDLATCDASWTISSPVGSFRDVWRVNTTLVQLSDDGTELMSLVAPG
jgi:hypothetical protein